MSFDLGVLYDLPADLRSIVWDFAGSLAFGNHRKHKFLLLEMKCWKLIMGRVVTPSSLLRQYGYVGDAALKSCLHQAYIDCAPPHFGVSLAGLCRR